MYTLGGAGGRGSSWTLTAMCSNGVQAVVSSINASMCSPGSGFGISNGLLTWWVKYLGYWDTVTYGEVANDECFEMMCHLIHKLCVLSCPVTSVSCPVL
jgi:hypothetical protein